MNDIDLDLITRANKAAGQLDAYRRPSPEQSAVATLLKDLTAALQRVDDDRNWWRDLAKRSEVQATS